PVTSTEAASAYFLADDLAAIKALRSNCSTVQGRPFCTPPYKPDSDNARKNRGFGLFVGLGGAGVIAIGAAVVGITRAPSAKKPSASAGLAVFPWIGPAGVGAVVTGGF